MLNIKKYLFLWENRAGMHPPENLINVNTIKLMILKYNYN